MRLLQTAKDKNRHKHIVYLNDESRTGATSKNKGHSHGVEFAPDGVVNLTPAEDGHTHDLSFAPPSGNEKEKQEDEGDISKDVLALYKEVKDYEKPSRKQAKESENFVEGEQWKEEVKRDLDSKKRAALTINEIEPKIDLLSGYQRRNRMDFKFVPVGDGDAKVAQILNVLVKDISYHCNYEEEETAVFNDEAIVGRGVFNAYVSYDKDIKGTVMVERFPWQDVYFGPHEKLDLSDCEYLIKTKWFSKAKMEQMWPDKADQITREIEEFEKENRDTVDVHHRVAGEQYEKGNNTVTFPMDIDLVNIARKEFRVLECWRKEYYKAHVFVNVQDDFYFNAEGWKDEDIKSVETLPGFRVISRDVYRMRVTKVASKVLLSDDYPEVIWDDFEVFPVYAKKRGRKWWGKVKGAIDPQKEINKRHSQIIDIANKMTAYGWIYDKETFSTPHDKQNFLENSSSPGFTSEVQNLNKIPFKVEGAKFPTELVNIMAIDSQKIKEVMNVNLELLGQNRSAAQSGVAIAQQKQQGLLGNEFLFDNLTLSKRKLGRWMLLAIQKVYTPERIYQVLRDQNYKNTVMIDSKPLEEYPKEAVIGLLKDADLSQYGVMVSESPWSPSNRMANFIAWAELAKQGIAVPPNLLIELSDLPDKEKVMQEIKAMQDQQMQLEHAKMQTELQKTMIASHAKGKAGVQ